MSIKSYFKGIRKRLKARWIYNYIDRHCGSVIEPYLRGERSCSSAAEELRVWVFWAQGFDNAPDLVKICNRQLHSVCSGSVVNLDMENYTDYVVMPPYILERLERGEMTLTHFSDLLRVSLLAQYGGMWIDSTCFVLDDLHTLVAGAGFFTYKSKVCTAKDRKYVACNRWAIWAIGTSLVNTPLFLICRDIFFSYWRSQDRLIDYYLVDHTVSYVYRNFDSARELIDGCRWADKTDSNLLMNLINDRYEREEFDRLMSGAPLYKLSYKKPLAEVDSDGRLTNYGRLKELHLGSIS